MSAPLAGLVEGARRITGRRGDVVDRIDHYSVFLTVTVVLVVAGVQARRRRRATD